MTTYYGRGYNPNDVFPGAQPTKDIDIKTICDYIDASRDVPVVYYFGGGAPTSISMGGRMWLDAKFTGPVNDNKGGQPGSPQFPGRMFYEFSPTSWNPESPDYGGQ